MVDHLQRGDEGVVFERAAENAEFDGVEVCQVHAGVAACAAFLGVFEDVLRLVLIAVTGCPAVELTSGAAAEFEEFLPVTLEEVQDSGDNFILIGFSITECGTVDVDVQTAGTTLVRSVAQTDGFVEDCLPRHFVLMEHRRHRVSDDFDAVLERTVVLAVDIFQTVLMCGFDNPLGIGITLSCTVDLKFHAKESVAGAVEDGIGFVVVVVDTLGFIAVVIATRAVGFVIIVRIVRLVEMDNTSAGSAMSVVTVVAVLTQREAVGTGVVGEPDTFAAALAFGGVTGDAVGTEKVVGEFEDILGGGVAVAECTVSVGHGILPRKMKITQPDWLGFMEIIYDYKFSKSQIFLLFIQKKFQIFFSSYTIFIIQCCP